jgi:hypothetical protein
MTDWYTPLYNTISDEMMQMVASQNTAYDNGPSDYYSGENNAVSGYIVNGKYTKETTSSAKDPYGTFYFKKIVTTTKNSEGAWVSKTTCTASTSTYTKNGTTYKVKHTYDPLTERWTYEVTDTSTGNVTVSYSNAAATTEAATTVVVPTTEAAKEQTTETSTTEATTTETSTTEEPAVG